MALLRHLSILLTIITLTEVLPAFSYTTMNTTTNSTTTKSPKKPFMIFGSGMVVVVVLLMLLLIGVIGGSVYYLMRKEVEEAPPLIVSRTDLEDQKMTDIKMIKDPSDGKPISKATAKDATKRSENLSEATPAI